MNSAIVVAGESRISFNRLAELNAVDANYAVAGLWHGEGQYSYAYAKYWNYNYSTGNTGDNTQPGVNGATLSGGLILKVEPKQLSDASVQIEGIMPGKAEYIGPAGAAAGY